MWSDYKSLDSIVDVDKRIAAAKLVCRNWVNGVRGGKFPFMALIGPNGVGKTLLATASLWEAGHYIDEDGVPFAPVGTIISAEFLIKSLSEGSSLPDLISPDAPVLIDDVGKEMVLRFVSGQDQARQIQAIYNTVIDFCYKRSPLIITGSNAAGTLRSLATYLGPSAFDRFAEMSKGFIIDLNGLVSYRKSSVGLAAWDTNGGK